ncbi:hypothetical protein H4Q26_010592 [Puccinia striiformis f. sp. tritici PST-130]|nr:hypothetical protein H4Q26_010592 [Puccinia striiformis f. sp. tritici PST-130]
MAPLLFWDREYPMHWSTANIRCMNIINGHPGVKEDGTSASGMAGCLKYSLFGGVPADLPPPNGLRIMGQPEIQASPSGTRDLRRSSSAHSTVNQVAVADILQGCGRSLRRARSKPSFKGSSIFSCIQNRRDQAETRGPSRSQEANVAARASPSPIELENSNGRDEPGSPGKEGYSITTFPRSPSFGSSYSNNRVKPEKAAIKTSMNEDLFPGFLPQVSSSSQRGFFPDLMPWGKNIRKQTLRDHLANEEE